jgi:hypothetical protein
MAVLSREGEDVEIPLASLCAFFFFFFTKTDVAQHRFMTWFDCFPISYGKKDVVSISSSLKLSLLNIVDHTNGPRSHARKS